MTDIFSKKKRSWLMSRVGGRETKLEILVRKYLHLKGFRFRKNDKRYPGTPDLVLPKYNTIIFVHGCFWHRHPGYSRASTPASRQDYWLPKFQRTIDRDRMNQEKLRNRGWNVLIVWECELKNNNEFNAKWRQFIYETITA